MSEPAPLESHPEPKPRGFAAMDPTKQRQIASLGGTIAHERGRAREFTAEEARAAGSKGGRAVSQDRLHMSRIGSLGGKARARRYSPGVSGYQAPPRESDVTSHG